MDRQYYVVALDGGWLVGKAVVFGSGNKRGSGLQAAAGILAFVSIVGGRYLFVNHLVSAEDSGQLSSWLTFPQFMTVNNRLLENGSGIGDLVFSAVAVSYAVVYPRADKLVSEAPTGVRGWRRWVR